MIAGMVRLPEGKHGAAVALWAFLGFVIGLTIVTPLILSTDRIAQIKGGIGLGGIPGAWISWLCGRRRDSAE
jgi:hypothetical protein